MRYRHTKHYYYLGIRKSTLIVVLILALIITGSLFIFRGLAGQRTILSPVGEGNPKSLITYDEWGYPKDINGNWIENEDGFYGPLDRNRPHLEGKASWYGTGENECMGCLKHYDENGLYYIMSNGQRLDDNKATMACGVYNSCDMFPVGSKVLVQNVANGMFTEVRVTDRGSLMYGTPNVKIADLTKEVMKKINAEGNPRVRIFRVD